MKRIIIVLSALFSAGALAEKRCAVYLPMECLEVMDTRVSDSQRVFGESSVWNIKVEVKCKMEESLFDQAGGWPKHHLFRKYLFEKIIDYANPVISVDFIHWKHPFADIKCERDVQSR